MRTNKNYYGTDLDLETSLFEYGLLVKEESKGKYSVIYGIDNNGEEYISFQTTTYTNSEAKRVINESWFNKKSFFSFVGLTQKEWLKSDISHKLSDLVQYYGTDNIFGSPYCTMDKEQVLNIL